MPRLSRARHSACCRAGEFKLHGEAADSSKFPEVEDRVMEEVGKGVWKCGWVEIGARNAEFTFWR